MEPGYPMPHLKGISNNPYPEPNQPNSSHFFKVHSNNVLPSTPRPSQGLLTVGFSVKTFKALLPSSILAT